jgi:hypothetical protein
MNQGAAFRDEVRQAAAMIVERVTQYLPSMISAARSLKSSLR